MSEICTTCGLPQELCVCESIAKETQKIEVQIIKKKFSKKYTIISGFDDKGVDTKELAKKLKETFACGGTAKDNIIELQGDHKGGMKEFLMRYGFKPEMIIVK